MKERIADILEITLRRLFEKGVFVPCETPEYTIEVPREEKHGDFATNLAMTLARAQKKSPRQLAQAIIDNIEDPESLIERVEIAGPGFINFFVSAASWKNTLREIVARGDKFGSSKYGKGRKVQVEFVSANPTGPLHVGHGRGAAVGDALANMLQAAGFEVEREYYINDAGTQMETLGRSMLLRIRELRGEEIVFPENSYQGEYVRDLAREFLDLPQSAELPEDEEKAVAMLGAFAAGRILATIREDLEAFGVKFDSWFSEKSLVEKGDLDQVRKIFKSKDLLYEEEGALWFKATEFGDEKDRVLVRSNGAETYFFSDVAYHWDKVRRGFDLLVDVWGADHHGYIPRVRASLDALGGHGARLTVLMVQLVNLMRGGEQVAMSKRAAHFVTLREVIDEVGADVARFIFLTRKSDASLDFDLELAKEQSNDNPVYYVQYAHARIASVLRLAEERGVELAPPDQVKLDALGEKMEMKLIKRLSSFPDEIRSCAEAFEPHRLTYYLRDLVSDFHRFYHDHRILSDDGELTQIRLLFVKAIKTVIANGLSLLGVKAPESM